MDAEAAGAEEGRDRDTGDAGHVQIGAARLPQALWGLQGRCQLLPLKEQLRDPGGALFQLTPGVGGMPPPAPPPTCDPAFSQPVPGLSLPWTSAETLRAESGAQPLTQARPGT